MTIAIDYDDTYTRDRHFWFDFVQCVVAWGHTPVVVTNRDGEWDPIGREFEGLCPVLYAGPRFKRDVAREAGYEVDIWIDDMPETIGPPALLLELT